MLGPPGTNKIRRRNLQLAETDPDGGDFRVLLGGRDKIGNVLEQFLGR